MTEPSYITSARDTYDLIAADYAEQYSPEMESPLERALVGAYAEMVGAGAVVADIGCGPGHITAYLCRLGVDAWGIDLSPAMVDIARAANPGLRFEIGSMPTLEVKDGALNGIVAMYSTMHLPDDRLAEAFGEFHRVLAADGVVLVGFVVGDEVRHRTEALGHEIALDYHLRSPEFVAGLLDAAGFHVHTRVRREPEEPERLPRSFLIARRKGDH